MRVMPLLALLLGLALPVAGQGRGVIKQDFITLRFSVGPLDLRVTPLEDSLYPLLASDAAQSLAALRSSEQARIDTLGGRVRPRGVLLVTFFATAPNTRFDPRQLAVLLPGRRLEPIGVIPLSPGFANQQLGAREQAAGLVVFDQPIPVLDRFAVSYQATVNRDWEDLILPRLEAERARIMGPGLRDTLATGTRP